MQPTREQVIQWARDADLIDFRDENDDPHVKQMVDMLMHATGEAYSAGRTQALDEAAAVNKAKADQMESEAQAAHDNGEHDEVSSLRSTAWILSVCKAAIEQLKGKQ